jgi:oxygen-independent coproporphyrinogen-3 oxidase
MAGIYIHIPFCRNACSYCDFHFTISFSYIDEMLIAIIKELEIRKDYIGRQYVSSIYFGGGTPSLLKQYQLSSLLETIHRNYNVNNNPEITLEANPEDISGLYIKQILKLGINRLSIGIQSFFNEDLQLMNRIHNSIQAEKSIITAREGGINNLNIDLIYGFPGLTGEKWKMNLEKFTGYELEHLSAYHLTYEPGTVFYHRKRKERMEEQDEELSMDQFKTMIKIMKSAGYIHYEISNFAKKGFISLHNSGYWKQMKYIGIGPSAHSYDGHSRQWNISKNMSYIKGVKDGTGYFTSEMLEIKTKYHDYILTSLRTMWGTDLSYILTNFGQRFYNHILKNAEDYLKRGELTRKGDRIYLTESGIFVSDHIIRELFID